MMGIITPQGPGAFEAASPALRRPRPTMKIAMDERAKTLLKTLVERYIADGQPVGSRTLSKASGLELSPATIRNVMADLEELGLITSPHTSAGRIPTARGYRLFVDAMLTAQPRQVQSIAAVEPRAAAGPAAARDRQCRADAVESVELRRRRDRTAQGDRVPPHRVHAAVGEARARDPGRTRRRRPEPRHLHRTGLHRLAAAGSQQLPDCPLRRADARRGARAAEVGGRCAAPARSRP